ncbi:UNVERIFIED_CONTAM: F-box protein SKIP8 [Sesamum calycinum]|uniref:F-box protein SKIP8 n=1 Tax=Sesamum calycinum TaxID=2727403 RepID=A0AAW2QV50_9LAMI
MEVTITSIFFTSEYSSFLVALFCILFVTVLIFRKAKLQSSVSELEELKPCECAGGQSEIDSGEEMTARVGGGVSGENGGEMMVERQTGASMMEQLVPEITTHALSYLDYPSLCRLSMTNSLMRKAANDDNAWKALYHKDFTLEQDSVIPANGWKAYYAATRAIVNINAEFFRIVKERSLPAMGQLWLNADYVKCFHATGESFSGGCKACGREEIEKGCNGEGRIQGGIATVPGFGWWPIKAYRPCPAYVASGGRYRRSGQSMDEVVSGGGAEMLQPEKVMELHQVPNVLRHNVHPLKNLLGVQSPDP